MKTILFILMLMSGTIARTQNWEQVGDGASGFVAYLTPFDSILYLGGNLKTFDNVQVRSVAQWDGETAHPVGMFTPCNPYCDPPSYLGRIDNDLLYSNTFDLSLDGLHLKGLSRWDGAQWSSIGNFININPITSDTNTGYVIDVQSINGRLYASGFFNNVDGESANSIAYLENDQWHGMDFPTWFFGDPPSIHCIEYYDDKIWVGGNFESDSINGGILEDLAYWDSTGWHSANIAPYNAGALSGIGDMIVYKGDLYVAGDFNAGTGYPGTMITRLRNGQWESVGAALPHYIGRILRMEIINDELYVVGAFYYIGDGFPATCIAKWDGQRWCSFGTEFTHAVVAITEWNGDIYIGGGFTEIADFPVKYIAKWIGGDFVADCTEPLTSFDITSAKLFHLYPNPLSTNLFTAEYPDWPEESVSVSVVNSMGIPVLRQEVNMSGGKALITLPELLPPGYYTVSIWCDRRGEQVVQRFVRM